MIRREFKTTDGAVHWLLVSQVEHARHSGLVARHWTAADLSPYVCDGQDVPRPVSDEILAAITHHDDGWSNWEAMPRLDPEHGRPYSFMNELPLEESLTIWDDSITAARQIGLLAGWLVASHFYELLCSGNHSDDDRAQRWLKETDVRRHRWLREWQHAGANHSPRLADRALRLLQACDFLSLWLCCDCPVAADEAVKHVEPFQLHWREHGIGPYRFSAERGLALSSKSSQPFADLGWLVPGTAWPFTSDNLNLTGNAWLVLARRYDSGRQLIAARRPVELRWKLVRLV